MRYWEINEARMGKRDFAAVKSSEVLVGFEFEIAYERVDHDQIDYRNEFFRRFNGDGVSHDDWIEGNFGTVHSFIRELNLEPDEPVTYGEVWEDEDGDEETRPDNFDDVIPGYAWVDGRIVPYDDFDNFSDVEDAFEIPSRVYARYEDWVSDRESEIYDKWLEDNYGPRLSENEIKEMLEERTGLTIHDSSAGYTQWFVTEDRSIEPSGIELVSPPMPVKEAIAALYTVLNAMSDPLETNSTTGLHINISVPKPDDIDLLKLLLFMGERYLLDMFGREGNVYTLSLIDKVKNMIADMEDGKSIDTYIWRINDELIANAGHYNVIDIKKLKKGYLEFRPAGGEGYQYKAQEVEDTVLRLVRCIELACDRSEEKTYLKKLMALVSPTTRWSEIGLRDEEQFREMLAKDQNVVVSRDEVDLQDVTSVADFFWGMVFAGTPTPATQAVFRRIIRLFSGEKRDYLNGVLKRLDQPWMGKLLK